MFTIAARPPIIDNISQSSKVTQFNTWLFSIDCREIDCQSTLKVATLALMILGFVGYFLVIGVFALMDWYEERQTIIALNEAFGTNDILTICSRLQNTTEPLESSHRELGLHNILSSSLISFQEKFELCKETERLFTENNYTQQREFFIPIIVANNQVEVPFSLLETSSILKSQLTLEDGEVDCETEPSIHESRHFSLKDFQQSLPLLTTRANISFNYFEPWLKTLAIAHFLDCDSKVIKKIAESRPFIQTQEITIPRIYGYETHQLVYTSHIREISRCSHLPEKAIGTYVAELLNSYIRKESLIHQKSMNLICNELRSIPGFLELARTLSIKLNLRYISGMNQEDLEALLNLFPSTEGLDLSFNALDSSFVQQHLNVPSHIIPNLTELKLLGSNVTVTFPQVNSLPRLKILTLSNTTNFNVPCPNLEIASLKFHNGLAPPEDFFDNLPHLKGLYLQSFYSNLRAPVNCPSLKVIDLLAPNVDLSPLNGHQSIESVQATYIDSITEIDTNQYECPNLRAYQIFIR